MGEGGSIWTHIYYSKVVRFGTNYSEGLAAFITSANILDTSSGEGFFGSSFGGGGGSIEITDALHFFRNFVTTSTGSAANTQTTVNF